VNSIDIGGTTSRTMKQAILSLCLFIYVQLSYSQTLLNVEGNANSSDNVSLIDVNFDDGTSAFGATGMYIRLNNNSANNNRGMLITGNVGRGIDVVLSEGFAGTFQSGNGIGLVAQAVGSAANNVGVLGRSFGISGKGLIGSSEGGSGNGVGVEGRADSPTGTGVYGYNTAQDPTMTSYGVHGVAQTESGAGVLGENEHGAAVYGKASGNGIGIKGYGLNGDGGDFYSDNQNGITTQSEGGYGIEATSLDEAAGFFEGGVALGGQVETDLILGSDDEVEGADDGILSSDLNMKSSDLHFIANDRVIVMLDKDDDQDSYYQIINGKNDKILTLEENGNLDIMGTLSQGSDVNRKYDIQSVVYQDVLSKVSSLDIYEWKYIGEDKTHMGPMAQDFYNSFHLNNTKTRIASIDIDGVALASIKALYQIVLEQQKEIDKLKERL